MKKIVMSAALLLAFIAMRAQDKKSDYYKAYGERDSVKSHALALQFLKDYPMDKADLAEDAKSNIQYYRMYSKLLNYPAADMNKNVAKYINELPYLSMVDFYYHNISLFLLHKIQPASQLVPRSDIMIKRMPHFRTAPREYASMPAAEWAQKYERAYHEMLLTHVSLLHAVGRDAEALPFAETANNYYQFKNAGLNDDHVYILLALKKNKAAQEILETAVRKNLATPRMLELLKTNYIAQHKGEKGYDQYRESLKDENVQAAMEEELKKEFVNKELPAFTVYDVNGQPVTSADWKGKIVVLDFWASWCAPCKAAFPGMKMAKERLAEQKDVVFYFIVVHEHKQGYKEEVKKFLKENNFDFTVLFDGFDDARSSDEAAGLLKVGAIPHKMILDKAGNQRFSMMGYYGSPSKLADEIVMMVNMARK